MSAETETREPRGAREHHRAYGSTKPYVGQWWIWFGAIPLLGTLGWWLGWDAPTWVVWRGHIEIAFAPGDEPAARFMAVAVLFVGFALAGISVLIGLGHTRRTAKGPVERAGVALVILHTAVSWVAGALLVDLIIIFGWSIIMAITVGGGAAIGAFGWNMYRADPFRADPREDAAKGEDSFDKVLGIKGAQVKGKPEITDHHIVAEIEPPRGGHPDDIAKVLERIEYAIPAALPNRSRLDVDGITGKIKAVFMHSDPLVPWPLWAGPTAPGQSFELPGHCGYYEDGLPELVRPAKHVDDSGNVVMPSQFGSTGVTRSGKSGHAVALWTDLVFTRNDVLMIYIDGAKPGQSMAGRLVDDIAALAPTVAIGKRLLDVLASKIVPWRSEVMGAAGFRDWSHEAYEVTGLPALFVAIDEADLLCGLAAFRDLVTKCLSVGIFIHTIMPRVDGESMDTTARTAVNAWFVFGTGGDDHSHTFVMDKDTEKRGGGKVQKWGARKPGYHFLVGANWVPEDRYHLEARSLLVEFDQAFPHIKAGRAYRATWHPGEVEIFQRERIWDAIQPKRTSAATWSPVPAPAASTGVRIERESTRGEKETNMAMVDERSDTVLDPEVEPQDLKDWRREDADVLPPLPAPDDPEPGDIERFGQYTHRELEVPDDPDDEGEELTWGEDKIEAPTYQAAYDDLDRVLIEMWEEGITEFEPAEAIRRFRYQRSAGWFTKRLDQVAEGAVVSKISQPPYGLTLTRLGYKKLILTRVPAGTVAGVVIDPDPVVPNRGRTRS